MDVMQLKTLQDWVVERRLRIVPGVADVLVLGGKTKQFQAEIDLNRMIARRRCRRSSVRFRRAIQRGRPDHRRGRAAGDGPRHRRRQHAAGYRQYRAQPAGRRAVLLSDVAKVQVGFTPRLGIAGRDEVTDVVTGIVLMQVRTHLGDGRARARDQSSQHRRLAAGVQIEPFYDRYGDLVAITVNTVLHNMAFGIALIFLIQWVFLGNLRCALIVSRPSGGVVPGRDHHGAARDPPICFRWARSTSASSSTPPSSVRTSSAISRTTFRPRRRTR
jgi:cobalt-zinc-cadmium resistance protein CzcA